MEPTSSTRRENKRKAPQNCIYKDIIREKNEWIRRWNNEMKWDENESRFKKVLPTSIKNTKNESTKIWTRMKMKISREKDTLETNKKIYPEGEKK